MAKQAAQEIKTSLGVYSSLISILKGICVSYIITIPIFGVFAYILTCTNFPEKYISPVVIVTTLISILIASSKAARNARSMGWLNGAVVGLTYIAILYVLSSSIFKDFSVNRYVISMLLIGLFTGTIGGIIGINLKRQSKNKYIR